MEHPKTNTNRPYDQHHLKTGSYSNQPLKNDIHNTRRQYSHQKNTLIKENQVHVTNQPSPHQLST